MRTLLRSLVFVAASFACLFFFSQSASAANLTVCNSGVACTGTTISGVLTGASAGDTITVQGVGVNPSDPYDPTAESWPIQFRAASNTLVCAGGASISRSDVPTAGDIRMSTSSTISDCILGNISIGPVFAIGADGQSPAGIHILNNTFSTVVTSTISLGGAGATDFVIQGNSNIQQIAFGQNATGTRGIISNNTFKNKKQYNGSGVQFLVSYASTTDIIIRDNTFSNTVSAIDNTSSFFLLDGVNITFATNTILNPAQSLNYTDPSGFTVLKFHASGTNYIGGNFIQVPTSTSVDCTGIAITPNPNFAGRWASDVTVIHNTIVFGRNSSCTVNTFGISYIPTGSFTRSDLTINASYNLIDNSYGLASMYGAIYYAAPAATSGVTASGGYNGAYGFAQVVYKNIDAAFTVLTGATDTSRKPFLRTGNSDPSDDFTPAPFSTYLDVNGTRDIGAASAVRRTTTYLNPTGTIDYSTVDATSTSVLTDSLKSGDTVSFAAGNHNSFAVNSTIATSSLSFVGENPLTTFIVARTGEDALKLTSVTSSVVSGLTLKSATSVSYSYSTSKTLGTFQGLDYNQASGDLGSSIGDMAIFNGSVCQGPPSVVSADGTSVSGLDGTSDIHLVLFTDSGGARATGLVPDNYLDPGANVSARFNTACGGFLTAVAVATSTFTASGGAYTYNASSLASAGITLVGGVSTPVITGLTTGKAGLHLASSSVVASNVIFDANAYGVWVNAGSGSSTIMNATSTNNTLYDFRHDSSSTSTLSDVSFLTASTTFGSTAGFDVYYSGRVLATNTSASPLTNIYASTTPATMGSERSLGTTDSSGYTAFRSLLAHRMNSTSISLTNAGKNPYTWTTGASGGYIASSTTESLSAPYQTVTLAMSQRNMGFVQGSGAGLESVTATSIRLELSSARSGASTVDYTVSGGSATGSGTDYTLAAGTATIGAGETETTIDLTIIDDSIYEGNENIIIQLSNPSGVVLGTNEYIYTITDNDTAGVTLSEATASVTEGSTTDSYTVVLSSQPTSTVEVALSVSSAEATVSTSTIAFSTSNWNTPVTVTVTATDDSSVEGSHSATITHAASSTNLGYGTGLSITSVAVTITDNDAASSGGGGGGGGGGATGYIPSPLPAPVSATTTAIVIPPTINVTFLDEPTTNPEPTAPQPTVLPPASEANVKTLLQDAKSFGVNVSAADQARLASFIEFGTSPASKALGSGERRAVIRDVFETLGKAASTDAIEKLVDGQLSGDRNLEREKAQLVRARGTFNTIYGRDPNFKDASENLAWNTLMYRIRFPRDLGKEKTGIVGFQKTFRKTPSDPFQWAVVRVLGYVR